MTILIPSGGDSDIKHQEIMLINNLVLKTRELTQKHKLKIVNIRFICFSDLIDIHKKQ